MTYCRNTDLISSDEDTFDEIWSESDHLIWHQLDEPALAEVVDERGVHELVLKQNRGWLKNRRISNLGNGLHHQHPLLSQVWKDLGV